MPKSKSRNLSDMAYEVLQKKIITLELEPGHVLDESSLLKELEVSRTPFREAVNRLKADRLLAGESNKSTYVTRLDIISLRDLVESIIIVEKNLNAMAAQRAGEADLKAIMASAEKMAEAANHKDEWLFIEYNLEFHGLVAKAARNQTLALVHQNMRLQMQRYNYISLAEVRSLPEIPLTEHYARLTSHHNALIESIRKRDVRLAEEVSIEHIKIFHNRLLRALQDIFYL